MLLLRAVLLLLRSLVTQRCKQALGVVRGRCAVQTPSTLCMQLLHQALHGCGRAVLLLQLLLLLPPQQQGQRLVWQLRMPAPRPALLLQQPN